MKINLENLHKYGSDLLVHGIGIDVRKPTFMNLSVSNRCNARCEMCDIWRYESKDFTIGELEIALSNQYLSDISNFGITGGEPFLRQDLPSIIEMASKHLPCLKVIGITTNGFNSERIARLLPEMIASKPDDVSLRITVSLDGVGEVHNLTRGVPAVFKKVERSLDYLNAKFANIENCIVDLACTITSTNSAYQSLSKLHDYASKRNMPIIYRLAVEVERIFNRELIELNGPHSTKFQAVEVQKFLKERVDEQKYSLRGAYYRMMLDYLENPDAKRSISCKEKRDGIMVDSNGDVFVCSVSGKKIGNLFSDAHNDLEESARLNRREVRNEYCAKCFHDHMSHVPIKMILPILYNKIKLN